MFAPALISLSICLVALVVSTVVSAPQKDVPKDSPCPDLFRYDSINQPGQWSGNFLLLSEDDLHGVWIRVLFDNKVKEVSVDGDYDVVSSSDSNEVLIKNRNVLLKAGSATNVKITVKYDGNKFPTLIGYRLNAKTLCPELNTLRKDFFEGDTVSKDFLKTVLSEAKPIVYDAEYKCGLKQSSNSLSQPWNAEIFIKQGDLKQYVCKATLISPSHVITPAHCVTFKNDNIEVPASSLLVYLATEKDTEEVQIISVSKVKVHPGYEPANLFNDIAVLQLNQTSVVNEHVRPICLQNKKSESGLSLEGFHIKNEKSLGEAAIKKIDADKCAKKAPELKNILVDNSYCVSFLTDDGVKCTADSGSRLVSSEDNVSTLKGMVTVSSALQNKDTCDQDTVVVAVDVTRYLKWILYSLH